MRLLEKWFCVLGFCCFVVSERWIFVYNEYFPTPNGLIAVSDECTKCIIFFCASYAPACIATALCFQTS